MHLFVQISNIHFDASQNNILVSEHGVAQITDFGIARILGVRGYTTTVASRNVRYAAPELLPIDTETDIEDARPTTRSDIFSLGILFLQVRGCQYPFPSRTDSNIISYYSYSMGLMTTNREGCRTITSATTPPPMIGHC